MTEIRPPWLMSPRQALAIQQLAKLEGLCVEDFVYKVLEHLAGDKSTGYMATMLLEQLGWLLQGLPEDRSPYVERFEELLCNPFKSYGGFGGEVVVTIDAFINIHAPAAFAEAA